MNWDFIEGSRAFELTWGIVAMGVCLLVAVPTLWWWLPEHRRRFFPPSVDPNYRLQLAYGIFAMAMAFTNLGCRIIPHADLPFVHPTFFLISLALVVGLAPRVIALATQRAH